ncbi:MAG: hypothetical protein AAGI69_02950 [Cyanobacteria bacterium P01_H01_bin.21]
MASIKKILKFVLIIALCVGGVTAVGGVALVFYFGYQMEQATKTVTDVDRYSEFVGSSDDPLTSHFPKIIPDNAKNVKLHFTPGFLQGGTIFQLRMQLPPEEIASLATQFQPQAKRQYVSGSNNNSPKQETSPDGMTVTFDYRFHTGDHSPDEVSKRFPDNYDLYVLEDTRGAPEYDWNHPEYYGMPINKVTSEVVYWMEDW